MEETEQNQEQKQTQTPEPETPGKPKKEEKDLTAILSYIGILFLVPLLACKDNAFAQFHAKQGLVLFIAEIATAMISWIPVIGWLVGMICWIMWLVLSIMGIVNVLNGRQSPLPLIGGFAGSFKI